MGRKKVEMKRIEDKSSRQVAFSKRRSGLFKKAGDLSVLCDVAVAVVIFSNRGRLYEFSRGNSLARILHRYQKHSEAEGWVVSTGDCETEIFQSRFGSFQTSSELLEIVERNLEEPRANDLSVTDLVQLENHVDASLMRIRSRKTELMMESITALQEKEIMLREENKHLVKKLAAIETDGNDANRMAMRCNELAKYNLF